MTLLEVQDLNVSFPTSMGSVEAVRGVSFRVERGRTLGIVGESGSGKTVLHADTAPPHTGRPTSAAAPCSTAFTCSRFPDEQMRRIRGDRISVIFQDPSTA